MGRVDELTLLYRGDSYQLERFLKLHPGGWNTLTEHAGKDVTRELAVTGHSRAAYSLLSDYRQQQPEDKQPDQEDLVDWTKPVLWQVGKLGHRYDGWVHSPIDRNYYFVSSRWASLEWLTTTNWYTVSAVWLPIIAALICLSYSRTITHVVHSISIMPCFMCGLLLWPLLEYSIHRWIFHYRPPSSSPLLITAHFALHGVHHKFPFDEGRLLFPPAPALLLASALYCALYHILPLWCAPALMAGAITGYLAYDLTHFYLHYGSPAEGSYFYNMKRYHNQHHFKHQHNGFGISSPFWDHVFNTTIELRKLSFKIKW